MSNVSATTADLLRKSRPFRVYKRGGQTNVRAVSRPDALRARITEAGPHALLPIGHAFAKSARLKSQRQWYSVIILRWGDTILNRHFGGQYCMPCRGLPLTSTSTIRPFKLEHSTVRTAIGRYFTGNMFTFAMQTVRRSGLCSIATGSMMLITYRDSILNDWSRTLSPCTPRST